MPCGGKLCLNLYLFLTKIDPEEKLILNILNKTFFLNPLTNMACLGTFSAYFICVYMFPLSDGAFVVSCS